MSARQFEPVEHVGKDRARSEPGAYLESNEQYSREYFVALEKAKILREEVVQCYRTEGVNHYQNCREITQKYMQCIRSPSWGMKQPGGGEDDG